MHQILTVHPQTAELQNMNSLLTALCERVTALERSSVGLMLPKNIVTFSSPITTLETEQKESQAMIMQRINTLYKRTTEQQT